MHAFLLRREWFCGGIINVDALHKLQLLPDSHINISKRFLSKYGLRTFQSKEVFACSN